LSDKKTIALVANSTWNIHNFRLNLIDKFLEEGHDVVVIAPLDEYLTYKEKYPKVKHFGLRTLDRDGINPIKDILLIAELARRFKKVKPDLVIHFTNKPNIYGAFAAYLTNTKSIAVVTGLGYAFIQNGWMRKVITLLYQFSGRFHQKFIFENQKDRLLFIDSNIVNKTKAIAVKGCGVDTLYFIPDTKVDSPETVFTFIGRLLYDKGIKEFVEAAKIIRKKGLNTKFWIVGELDQENPATLDKEELLNWVENDIVYYHGFLKDVRPIIQSSDCIVLPSYREGLPRIIIEGMSMAKPVITTLTAGCEETVDEGQNGYLVNIKDSQALVTAMEKFIALSPSEKKDMGEKGRLKAVKEFDDKIIANDYYQIVKDILKIGT